jgi:hypothetical protein
MFRLSASNSWVKLGKGGVVMMRRDHESDNRGAEASGYGTPAIGDGSSMIRGRGHWPQFALTIG